MIAVIDNKPIYDHTCGDVIVIKDKRMAIDMLIVRRHIRQNNLTIRWVDTKQMLILTKNKDGKYTV